METNTEDTIEENVSTAEETEDEPTEPLENLEKPAPARKPRTQKQKAAFEKAREALAVKRANDKEFKAANKKPIGRPKKVAAVKEKVEPKARRSVAQGGRTARAQTVVDKQAAIGRSKDLYFHQYFKAKLPYLESCQAVRGGKE